MRDGNDQARYTPARAGAIQTNQGEWLGSNDVSLVYLWLLSAASFAVFAAE